MASATVAAKAPAIRTGVEIDNPQATSIAAPNKLTVKKARLPSAVFSLYILVFPYNDPKILAATSPTDKNTRAEMAICLLKNKTTSRVEIRSAELPIISVFSLSFSNLLNFLKNHSFKFGMLSRK